MIRKKSWLLAVLVIFALTACATMQSGVKGPTGTLVAGSEVQLESTAYVGFGMNGPLPAIKGEDPGGKMVSIPFKPTVMRRPTMYQGDFYVDEFTNNKIKEKWIELSTKDPEAAKKVIKEATGQVTAQFRNTGAVDPRGKIDPHGDVNLADIRRPAFFGQPPYKEEIAGVDGQTYVAEFTVPRDPYEQIHLKQTEPIKLRGWFIKGEGLPDGTGKRMRALAILTAGRFVELTAIQHPDDPLYIYNSATKQYESVRYPNKDAHTEMWDARQWRQYLHAFNRAGFDVLSLDKRGHGITGGLTSCDNGEMAEDLFRILDQMESGIGLRLLSPSGQVLAGNQAAGLMLAGVPAKKAPVVIGGSSQSSMITSWAMQKNFVGFTAYNKPGAEYAPPKGYNIKSALVFASFAAGIGYTEMPRIYREGAFRNELNTLYITSSEILANIDKWPAVFIGKGLWDALESTEGTFDSYRRAKGLKQLVFVRGPHSENECGEENLVYMKEKMVEFAVRSVMNAGNRYPEFKSFREAVLSSPPIWEPSSRP